MAGDILIVDDERRIGVTFRAFLTRAGHSVEVAGDYAAAMGAISDRAFDLIVADILLGGHTGLDILKAVRERGLRTPVVIITGQPTIDTASEAVRLGAFDYLTKPVEKHDLMRVVDVALKHKALLDREYRLETELKRQKRLYERIVEDQTELICRFTPEGVFTFVNGAYARYFGWSREALIGRRFQPEMPDEDRKHVEAHLLALSSDRPVAVIEHRVRMPDGNIRWQRWIDRAVVDADGRIAEYQSVGRDITEYKVASESLEKSRKALDVVFQSIPEGILTVDADFRVLQKNQPLAGMCCVADRLKVGMPIDPAGERCKGECFKVLRHTLDTGQPVRDYHVECRDGTSKKRHLVLTTAPLADSRSDDPKAMLVVRDITRLTDLEDRLRERESYRNIIGKSEPMQHLYTLMRQLADVDATVLITGESGTGKELVMEALHYTGVRANGPLVRVNCSALSDNLLESELFGHVRGAFTGAVKDREGRFRAAEGGTLFLDEIGDISQRIQIKLLRAIERKEYERVGDTRTVRADVRIIAATHVDLAAAVASGAFREDFYYRLKVMTIHIPPLRERREDIPLLTDHFLRHFGGKLKKRFEGFSDAVTARFMAYPWPGNVRELRHVIEHIAILCPGGVIGTEFLTPTLLEFPERPGADREKQSTGGLTPQAVVDSLRDAGGNKAKAARLLGIGRSTLYRKLSEFGLE